MCVWHCPLYCLPDPTQSVGGTGWEGLCFLGTSGECQVECALGVVCRQSKWFKAGGCCSPLNLTSGYLVYMKALFPAGSELPQVCSWSTYIPTSLLTVARGWRGGGHRVWCPEHFSMQRIKDYSFQSLGPMKLRCHRPLLSHYGRCHRLNCAPHPKFIC